MLWLDGQELRRNKIGKLVTRKFREDVYWIDLSEWSKNTKIFMSHVNGHQRMSIGKKKKRILITTTAECPVCQQQKPTSLQNGIIFQGIQPATWWQDDHIGSLAPWKWQYFAVDTLDSDFPSLQETTAKLLPKLLLTDLQNALSFIMVSHIPLLLIKELQNKRNVAVSLCS